MEPLRKGEKIITISIEQLGNEVQILVHRGNIGKELIGVAGFALWVYEWCDCGVYSFEMFAVYPAKQSISDAP